MKVFLDSNIPMYVAGGPHPNRDPAIRCLEKVQRGELEGYTSTEVLQEILYRYSALRRLDLARDVYNQFVRICPVILGVSLADTDRARDLLLELSGISARDAVHVGVMLNHQIELVATFDRGFDSVPGIQRLELV